MPPRQERPPTGGFAQIPDRHHPSGGYQQVPPAQDRHHPSGGYPQAPAPALDPDSTILTPPEPGTAHSSYSKLVPRADGPKSPAPSGSVDATVIGYASSVTGFHDLDVMGRRVGLRRPRRIAFTIAVVVGLLSSAALAMTILQSWAPPGRAYVLAGTMMAFATTLTTIFCAGIWQDLKKGALVGVVMGLCGSLGGVFVAAGWSTDSFRANVVEGWTGYSTTLYLALDDPSELVQTAACEKLIRRDDQTGRVRLLPLLTLSPRVAGACLSATSGSVMSQTLAGTIAQRWEKELVSEVEEPIPAHLADLPEAVSQLPVLQAERDSVLLHCAFGAPLESSRRRCAEVLGATKSDWVSRLDGLAAIAASERATRGVVALALDSPRLRPEQKKLRQQLDAGSKESYWAALELAQVAISRGQTSSTAELRASLEQGCSVDTNDIPTSRDTWFNVLDTAKGLRKAGADPADAVCRAVVLTFVDTAIETASNLIGVSARSSGRQEARDIDKGWLMINKHVPQTQSDLRAMIPSGVDEPTAQRAMQILRRSRGVKQHPLFLGDPAE